MTLRILSRPRSCARPEGQVFDVDIARLRSLMGSSSRGVEGLHTVGDFRRASKRILPKMIFDFIEGGADGEIGLTANRSALDDVCFAPRYLADVSDRDQQTMVLGSPVDMPFILSPAGLIAVAHPDGEPAVAAAAAEAGTIMCVSTGSCYTLEEIADASTGRLWFQLYLWKSDEVIESLIHRAEVAGYEALVVTVDVPVVGKRERDLRNGMSLPVRVRPRNVLDTALHLPWLWRMLNGPEITFGSLTDVAGGDDAVSIAEYTNRELTDPSRTWDALDSLRARWKGPLLVKGVMTAADARLAVDHGADAVIVSNHGGRQLGSVAGAAAVLPSIAAAVGDRAEVFLDGGICRGEDIVKARALGATAAMGGRAWVWGLAAGGQDGVTRVLGLLRDEIDRTLALIGCPHYDQVDGAALVDGTSFRQQ